MTTEDFQGLQAEVDAWAAGLEALSREPCRQLLGGLGQVLQDEPALQALEDSVSKLGGREGRAGACPCCPLTRPACAPSWSRACAVGWWSLRTVQRVPCSSAWCWPAEGWRGKSPAPSSTWYRL